MKTTKIAVHAGCFHADDALCLAILGMVYDTYEIIRTRDPKVMAEADLRVDVGATYDPAVGTYDHHQEGGAGCRSNGIPYAAAGLVWKHFAEKAGVSPEVRLYVDDAFIQYVDASDNGFDLATVKSEYQGLMPAYSFSAFISALNPSWQEDQSDAAVLQCFNRAVEVAGLALEREIVAATARLAANDLVFKAVRTAATADEPRILVLETAVPWMEYVVENTNTVLYVLYPEPHTGWMVQCVPPQLGSFAQRKPLPKRFAGKRDAELAELTGIADAVFVHPGQFIGGCKSFDGALALARLALNE